LRGFRFCPESDTVQLENYEGDPETFLDVLEDVNPEERETDNIRSLVVPLDCFDSILQACLFQPDEDSMFKLHFAALWVIIVVTPLDEEVFRMFNTESENELQGENEMERTISHIRELIEESPIRYLSQDPMNIPRRLG
jgi:hypothetical protein